MLDFILSKLKEGTTWAGIASLVAGLAFIPHVTQVSDTILLLGTFVPGLFSIWFNESK